MIWVYCIKCQKQMTPLIEGPFQIVGFLCKCGIFYDLEKIGK